MTEIDLFNKALTSVGDYVIELESSVVVSSATAANPVVVTTGSNHGYVTDELVLMTAMDEMTEVNGRVFKVNVVTVTTFDLVGEDGTAYTAEATGGLVQRLNPSGGEKVRLPFDLWPGIRSEVLQRNAWNDATVYHRLSRLDAAKTITAITQASRAEVTSAAHGYSNGDLVLIEAVAGMIELNDRYFSVGNAQTNTFELNEDSTDFAAYTSGGTAKKALTPLVPEPPLYAYRYTLPTDYERVLGIVDPGQEEAAWERVGLELYTDVGITAQIRYTKLLIDPAQFSASLFAAFALVLGNEMAPKLTDSASREERSDVRAESRMRNAARTDGQESSALELTESSWLRAHRVGVSNTGRTGNNR